MHGRVYLQIALAAFALSVTGSCDLASGQFVPRSGGGLDNSNAERIGKPNLLQEENAAQQWRVELEVVYNPRVPPRDGGRWAQFLTEAGFDRVVLRSEKATDQVDVQTKKILGKVTLVVTGMLVGDQVVLPKQRFSLRDADAVGGWVRGLKSEGPRALEEKVAFGLLADELVALSEKLAAAIRNSTTDLKLNPFLGLIQKDGQVIVMPTASSALVMDQESPIAMQLQGLSVGTGLAAYLRPMGLVMVPSRTSSGSIVLQIRPAKEPEEYWPVGWPTDGSLVDRAPRLLEKFEANFQGQTVAEALQLVEIKSGVRILLDHNTLLRRRIDFNKRKATLRRPSISFRSAVGELVSAQQPSGVVELRMDEAGTPFLWINGGVE